jgi:Tfp pilus assembly protein PilX
MRFLTRRLRQDDTGSALITALMVTALMLGFGMALLSIVDIQASSSATERTRDRSFNLAESVLNSEAFVLGRNWPATVPTPNNVCGNSTMAFSDTLGSTASPSARTALLRTNLNASYTDSAFAGAAWKVNVCDDDTTSSVWSKTLLTTKLGYDQNANSKVWVRAEATVGTKTRAIAGLVSVRTSPVLKSKYGLATGSVKDDLGTTVDNISTNALGGVLSGLLGTTPTVATDPTVTATSPPSSGVTGVRCGALDLKAVPASTCLSGTVGALSALPIITTLLTGDKLEQFPTTTAATSNAINQMRTQAVSSNTYYTLSAGASTVASAPACTFTTNTGTRSSSTVVFIEKVGTGDQYCYVNVATGVQWKALVIGSGRVIIRGSGTTTAAPVFTGAAASGPQVNTFSGVVYALNLQRLTVAEGGLGLGDAATARREVVRIESSAHVKGAVSADGKSGMVTVVPPPLTFSTSTLITYLVGNGLVGTTLNGLLGVLGVNGTIDALINGQCLVTLLGSCTVSLPALGTTAVVNGILNQLQSQRAAYGSAITSDVAAVNLLTVYGASGVIPKTFRELIAGS